MCCVRGVFAIVTKIRLKIFLLNVSNRAVYVESVFNLFTVVHDLSDNWAQPVQKVSIQYL